MIAKRVMLGTTIIHNDKVTAAGLQKIKPPHYDAHFLSSVTERGSSSHSHPPGSSSCAGLSLRCDLG